METKTELKEEAKTEVTKNDTVDDDLKVIEVLETKRVRGRKLGSKNKKTGDAKGDSRSE